MIYNTLKYLPHPIRKYIFRSVFVHLFSAISRSIVILLLLTSVTPYLDYTFNYVFYFFVGILSFLGWFYLSIKSLHQSTLSYDLNNRFPILEYSAELFFKSKESYTLFEKLQVDKIKDKIKNYSFSPSFKEVRINFSLLLFSTFIYFISNTIDPIISIPNTDKPIIEIEYNDQGAEITSVDSISLSIHPPNYTGLRKTTNKWESIAIPEESLVSILVWGKQIKNLSVILNDSISVNDTPISDFNTRFDVKLLDLTTVNVVNKKTGKHLLSKIVFTPIKDTPPVITILNPDTTKINMSIDSLSTFQLTFAVFDNYGVESGHLLGTLAKGTGENVRFRNQSFPFNSKRGIKSKKALFNASIPLSYLDIEEGDELYFNATFVDNSPSSNSTLSETIFLMININAETALSSIESGLPIDRIPEYFRSQRQIIIDTEKLLSDKPSLSIHEFNQRSQSIAIEQKALRLRYGQYLGEENDSGIDTEISIPDSEENETENNEHIHDHEHDHTHNSEPSEYVTTNSIEELLAPLVHAHDNGELNSFFVDTTRQMLKLSLAHMWDSERYLRVFSPQTALPFQYEALKYLKLVQQRNRVYVKKSSGTPIPIPIEEKRLTGELSGMSSKRTYERVYDSNDRLNSLVESALYYDSATLKFEQWLTMNELELTTLIRQYKPELLPQWITLVENKLDVSTRFRIHYLFKFYIYEMPAHPYIPVKSVSNRSTRYIGGKR